MSHIFLEIVSTVPLPVRPEADEGFATLTCTASSVTGRWSVTVSTSSSLAWSVVDRMATWGEATSRCVGGKTVAVDGEGHPLMPDASKGDKTGQDASPGQTRLLDAVGPIEGGFFFQLIEGECGLEILAAPNPVTPALCPVVAVPVTPADLTALMKDVREPEMTGSRGYWCVQLGKAEIADLEEGRLEPTAMLELRSEGVAVIGSPMRLPVHLSRSFLDAVIGMLRQWESDAGDWDGRRRAVTSSSSGVALELQTRGVLGDVAPGGQALRVTMLVSGMEGDVGRRVPLWYWWVRPQELARTIAEWDGGDSLTLWGATLSPSQACKDLD